MAVILDHIIFSLQKSGGITHWWLHHTDLMAKEFADIEHTGLYANSNEFAQRNQILATQKLSDKSPRFWPLRRVSCASKSGVFHSSYYRRPQRGSKLRTVVTFHDASAIRGGGLRARAKKMMVEACLEEAAIVHCISRHSSNELLELFPYLDPQKIKVIYHGLSPFDEFEPVQRIPQQWSAFVLWVGNRWGYKNGGLIFESLSALPNDLGIVLVGGEPLSAEEKSKIDKFKLQGRMIFESGISKAKLGWLYNNAVALWYTSLNEGFGFPPLEAASQGCPVFGASGHSVEEVCGEWASLTKFPSSEWLVSETIRVLNKQKNLKLRDAGTIIAKKFSWDLYREKMAQVYRDLI